MKALKVVGIGIAMLIGIIIGYVMLAAEIPEWLHLPSWVSMVTVTLALTTPMGIITYLINSSD